ncbi:YgfZ/GcvT domain-containing protein [Haloferula sargassicola]|uniref:tRNA-modifying protein YgfZ n=1 Tax=Haloferula sargassicola TaxID=490096 RepID=A0ABP9UJ55_9BACT
MENTFPPESPGIVTVRGADAVRFLNGQLTQDVRHLGDETRLSCLTDAKGKLQHLVEVLAGPADGILWILCAPEETDPVFERLDRYLIADEVELGREPGSWTRIRSGGPLPEASFSRQAFWPDGWRDHWFKGSPAGLSTGGTEADREERRIRDGIPQRAVEAIVGMLPPEAGLDALAVSFEKGCFIGQETLSRIKSAGKVNRRLQRFALNGPAAPGDGIQMEGQPCGELTSVAPSGEAALGFLKKAAFGHRHFTLAGRPDSTLTVV